MESGADVKEEQDSVASLDFNTPPTPNDAGVEGEVMSEDEVGASAGARSATPRQAAMKQKRVSNANRSKAPRPSANSSRSQSHTRKSWATGKRVYSGSEGESEDENVGDRESEQQQRRPTGQKQSSLGLFDDDEEEDELMLGSGVSLLNFVY